MTNGGGQTEDERLKALEGDFGVQVSYLSVGEESSGIWLTWPV